MSDEETKKRGRPAKSASVPILLTHDAWIGDERHYAGDTVEFPVDQAKKLIAEGKATRNDPFPGE